MHQTPTAPGFCSRRPLRSSSTSGRHLLLPRFRTSAQSGARSRGCRRRTLLAGLLHGEGVLSVNATRWHHWVGRGSSEGGAAWRFFEFDTASGSCPFTVKGGRISSRQGNRSSIQEAAVAYALLHATSWESYDVGTTCARDLHDFFSFSFLFCFLLWIFFLDIVIVV